MATVSDILSLARDQLNKPYVWGAAGPDTYDCSGLVTYVFGHHGINLPHHSEDQVKYGQSVNPNAIQPGDLVFSDWGDGYASHVGIAVSPNRIINAPKPGDVVSYADLNSTYRSHLSAVRRIPLTGSAGGTSTTPADWITVPGIPVPIPTKASDIPIVGDVGEALSNLARTMVGTGRLATRVADLFLPSNMIRAVSGILGVLLIFAGLYFIGAEIRDSS